MVLLAKWILEQDPGGRILVVTDRDELDKQIEGVVKNARVIGPDAASPRITSRAEFVDRLGATIPRLLCALIHKFDVADLKGEPPSVSGRFYVFVDECHRTQGGDMNRQMKRWLEGAIFIGFTGTPLLRKNKPMTRDVFGTYIHTYKFHEGVADGVILDLKYEARDVPQRLTSQAAIDQWFEQKTKGLNNFQKAVLRRRWATMEELMSAGERKQRIIADIIEDFSLKPRLNNNRGTAILVAASIYDACHYYRLFQNTSFGRYCGIITSYQPNHNAISREPANSDERYKFDTYTLHVLKDRQTTKQYEDEAKRRFIKEPAQMKLLIVVSKLLTGFDAPSCTYIYLDNELRDHNLFQAICRTNRLDGDDKDYGHIVDFKELFSEVQEAIAVYSSDELDTDPGSGGNNNVHLKNWLSEGRKRLDEAREALHYLCAPVQLPREVEQYLHYFCGDAANPNALNETETLRISFYKAVAVYVRAFAAMAQVLTEAGYSDPDAAAIQKEVQFYGETRSAIKKHSGEELDIKPYEADMRHLLNTYVQADPATDLGKLSEMSLTESIIETGIHDAIARKLNEKGKLSRNAIAEGIINNVRKTIIRDQLTDPRFYEEMSKLLDDLIKQSREDAAAYEEFLRKAEALVKRLAARQFDDGVPAPLHGRQEATVIYNNLPQILAAGRARADGVAESPDEYEDERLRLALEIDRGDARAGAGRMEGRPSARGPGTERAVSAAGPQPRGHARIVRTGQESAGLLMAETIQVGEIAIALTRKDVKHAHLSVHPPSGRVTLVAPNGTRSEVARAYAISKLGWIRDQQAKLRGQARETPRQFVERESHYLWGRRYLLTSGEEEAKPSIRHSHRAIMLTVRPGSNGAKRTAVMHEWHKSLMHEAVRGLIARWEPKLGVDVAGYFLQRMKTKWGSCNHRARTIRLNTELVKKPKDLLDYVVVHEMLHLTEPTHSEQFLELMSEHYPGWREARAELNELPLAAESWKD